MAQTQSQHPPRSPLQAVHVLRPAIPISMGSAGKGTGPFVWGQDGAKGRWPPQLWLPASLDVFLRKAQDVVLTGPIEGGVRQTVELEIGRNSAWNEADLFDRGTGLGCWMGPWGPALWGAPCCPKSSSAQTGSWGSQPGAWLPAQSNFPAKDLPGRKLQSAFRTVQLGLGQSWDSEGIQPHPPSSEGALRTQPGLRAGQGGLPASSWGLQYIPG